MVRRESEVLTVPENKLLLVCIPCITNFHFNLEKNNFPPRAWERRVGRRDIYMSLHVQQYHSHFTERDLWSVHIFKAEEKEIR